MESYVVGILERSALFSVTTDFKNNIAVRKRSALI